MNQRRAPKAEGRAAMRRRELAQCRPEVIVEFLFDKGLLFISVRNIGDKPAARVSVKFDRKLMGLGGTRDVSVQALFRNIEFLGPQREIVTLLDRSSAYFGGGQPTKLTARLRYNGLDGKRYAETINHDLEIYRDLIYTESFPRIESSLGNESTESEPCPSQLTLMETSTS